MNDTATNNVSKMLERLLDRYVKPGRLRIRKAIIMLIKAKVKIALKLE